MMILNAVVEIPGWAITLVSVAASAIVSGFFGFMIKHGLEKYFQKRDQEKDEQKTKLKEAERIMGEQENERLVQTIGKMIDDKVSPMSKKLDAIGDGTLSSLRNDILTCYYKCVDKGYRNDYDYTNVHDMYESYYNLNGNSFVADVMKRFDELPTKEDWEKKHKRKRQPLRETQPKAK